MQNSAAVNETGPIFDLGNNEPQIVEALAAYAADQHQTIVLVIEDEHSKYEIAQVFGALTDDVLAEYDRLREVSLDSHGSKTDVVTESTAADDYLFGKLCRDVLGYDGERPDNWKDLIDPDEKRFGLGKLLAFKILSNDKEKPLAKRSWSASSSTETIQLQCYFDGQVLETAATFTAKTPADVAAYAAIRSRVSLVEKGFDEQALKIPASMAKKAKLFDKLAPTVTGYDGRVPLHHKAAFVTAFFEPRIADAEKK